jgi:hypothetical protein
VLGEAAGQVLGIEQLAVYLDIKLTTPAYFQLSFDAGLPLDCGRETRGLGLVVSHMAVLDDYPHGRPPSGCGAHPPTR